jgi:ADP-ribose pyrophosphatase YjhB (NUDIX family)
MLDAWHHEGGPPIWKRQKLSLGGRLGKLVVKGLVYPWKNLRRRLKREPAFVPAPSWHVAAYTVIRNGQTEVLWLKQGKEGQWELPGGSCSQNEAPWETAVRHTYEQTGLSVRLDDLTGVYVPENEAHMALVFTAVVTDGQTNAADRNSLFHPRPGTGNLCPPIPSVRRRYGWSPH